MIELGDAQTVHTVRRLNDLSTTVRYIAWRELLLWHSDQWRQRGLLVHYGVEGRGLAGHDWLINLDLINLLGRLVLLSRDRWEHAPQRL